MKYEYDIIEASDLRDALPVLNRRGVDGWQQASMRSDKGTITILLERKIVQSEFEPVPPPAPPLPSSPPIPGPREYSIAGLQEMPSEERKAWFFAQSPDAVPHDFPYPLPSTSYRGADRWDQWRTWLSGMKSRAWSADSTDAWKARMVPYPPCIEAREHQDIKVTSGNGRWCFSCGALWVEVLGWVLPKSFG